MAVLLNKDGLTVSIIGRETCKEIKIITLETDFKYFIIVFTLFTNTL